MVVKGVTQPLGGGSKGGVDAKPGEAHQHGENNQAEAESW